MARDSRMEDFLTIQKVDWKYLESVPIASISQKESLANQARLGERLDQAHVDRLTLSMIDQRVIPALIAWRNAAGLLVLADGNHRMAAAIAAEREEIDVYLVLTSDMMVLDRLTRMANLLNGKEMPLADALAHAKHWVRAWHATIHEAAALWLIKPESVLATALRTDAIELRFAAIGIRSETIGTDRSKRLHAIQSDPVLKQAVVLVRDAKLSAQEVSTLVTELNAKRSEADQMAWLASVRARPEIVERIAQAGPKPGIAKLPSLSWRFEARLRELGDMLEPDPRFEALQITGPNQKARMLEAWARLSQLMNKAMASASVSTIASDGAPAPVSGRTVARVN